MDDSTTDDKLQSDAYAQLPEDIRAMPGLPYDLPVSMLKHPSAIRAAMLAPPLTPEVAALLRRLIPLAPIPAEWVAARNAVFERDAYACCCCGNHGTAVCERVRRAPGPDTQNLITLCHACRDLAQAHDQGMHDRGLWLWSTQSPAEVPLLVPSASGYERVWLLPDGTTTGTCPNTPRKAKGRKAARR